MNQRIWLLLFLAIPIFGLKVKEMPEINAPTMITSDESHIYIVENPFISIYSQHDLTLIAKFGKSGEGPEEFKGFVSKVDVNSENILINSVGRLSWFNKSGKFLKQKRYSSQGLNYKTLGKNYVGMRMDRRDGRIIFSINIVDQNLVKKKEIFQYAHPFFKKNPDINPVDIRKSSYFSYDNILFIDDSMGKIKVYDQNGLFLYSINHKFEKLKITDDARKRYIEFWESDLRSEYIAFKERLEFPSYFPPILDFRVADQKIYIFTYKEKNKERELIILDLKGNYIGKVMVPLADLNMLLPHMFTYFTITNNKIYKLFDNIDDEIWELHIIDLSSYL